MGKKFLEVNADSLLCSDTFRTASADELRVLCGMLLGVTDGDELSELVNVPRARCHAAIALFEAEGFAKRTELVTDEFESGDDEGELKEKSRREVAREIRDKDLKELISGIANMMKLTMLSSNEVAKVTAAYIEIIPSEEYLLELAAYLADLDKLTVNRLVNDAFRFTKRGIDTPEALREHIEYLKLQNEATVRVRRIIGNGGRKPTSSEMEYFTRWVNEFGFSDEVIAHAYDVTVNNNGGTLRYGYMNSVLKKWHEAGCVTVADCERENERFRLEYEEKKKGKKKKTDAEKPSAPKYGAFSAEDALMRALERSYGTDDEK